MCHLLRRRPADDPDRLGGEDQVVAFGDRQADHAETEEERHAQRQPRPERIRKGRQRETEQQAHQQAQEQADDGGDELGRRELLDLAQEPAGGDDRQVGQDREPDDDPRNHPRGQQPAATRRFAEELRGGGESEPDEATQGRAEQADVADHVSLASSLTRR